MEMMYLDLMHSFPPRKLLQFSFNLYLMETLYGRRTEPITIVYYASTGTGLLTVCFCVLLTSISSTLWKIACARHSLTCLWWALWISFSLYSLSGTIRPLLVI